MTISTKSFTRSSHNSTNTTPNSQSAGPPQPHLARNPTFLASNGDGPQQHRAEQRRYDSRPSVDPKAGRPSLPNFAYSNRDPSSLSSSVVIAVAMPKRSYDSSSAAAMPTGARAPPVKALKTERSHEENQERAYIAASRRADRSLEARVQSARMASEIHRRRTGRGLKVTEEIVVKEEMYEEEEDDLPRQYKYLTAHLQTNSPAMNNRVNAYITTQAAMATMARYNEVNRLFSESFPSATAYHQQLNQSMYMNPLVNNGDSQFPSCSSPTTQTVSPTMPHETYQSADRRASSAKSSPPSGTSIPSPPALSPSSGTTNSPELRGTPYQTPAQTFPNIDPQLQQTSAFTSELPNEVKMMANIDMSDPMAPHFFGGNPSAYQLFGQHPNDQLKLDTDQATCSYSDVTPMPSSADSNHDSALFSSTSGFTSPFDAQFDGTFEFGRMGTPGPSGNEGAWESFVDFGPEQ